MSAMRQPQKLRIHVDGILDGWSYVQPYDPEGEAKRAVKQFFKDHVYPALEENEAKSSRCETQEAPVMGEDQ